MGKNKTSLENEAAKVLKQEEENEAAKVLTTKPIHKPSPKQQPIYTCPNCDFTTRDSKSKCSRHKTNVILWNKK